MILLLLACHSADKAPDGATGTTGPSLPTPEEIVATATEGDTVTTRGTIFSPSFEDIGSDHAVDHYLLIRSVQPDGAACTALDCDDDRDGLAAWGLGLYYPAESWAARTVPFPLTGATVEVTGTFSWKSWDGLSRPILQDLQALEVVEGPELLADVGGSCALDLDCRDELICDRESLACAAPPEEITWGSSWRDVIGGCSTDADCPLGQVCDDRYEIPSEGDYKPPYLYDENIGQHLCVPPDGATIDEVCPRTYAPADIAGARFEQGREICIEGIVLLTLHPPDGDSHIQLVVDEPLPFPTAESPYYLFGGTTESVPPYKDPSRPQGDIGDPAIGTHIVVLGTVRYDRGHGWYEVHPAKVWWELP